MEKAQLLLSPENYPPQHTNSELAAARLKMGGKMVSEQPFHNYSGLQRLAKNASLG